MEQTNGIDQYLYKAAALGASDLHITAGASPWVRVNGRLAPLADCGILIPTDTAEMLGAMMGPEQKKTFDRTGQVDFSYVLQNICRCRVNVFRQRRSWAGAVRLLSSEIPTLTDLNLPQLLGTLALRPRGLVLLTGPTGSGKSSTLAAMVDVINRERRCHVITLEDPIEYLYRHGSSIINQREVGDDTDAFPSALRAALREDPDVLLVGEMRDLETISTALTAAETGHLVLSTLHTANAVEAVDRIIDIFPPHQQQQVRTQLAAVLQAVISQQLIPYKNRSGRVPALEILLATDAVRSMIRDDKCHQIPGLMQTGVRQGMLPMDLHLARLVKSGAIAEEEATSRCMDIKQLRSYLNPFYENL